MPQTGLPSLALGPGILPGRRAAVTQALRDNLVSPFQGRSPSTAQPGALPRAGMSRPFGAIAAARGPYSSSSQHTPSVKGRERTPHVSFRRSPPAVLNMDGTGLASRLFFPQAWEELSGHLAIEYGGFALPSGCAGPGDETSQPGIALLDSVGAILEHRL